MYDHPLQVRRALGELRYDIQTMRLGMKDLLQAANEKDRQTILQEIAAREVNANGQFAILNFRYLGPKSDIDQARFAYDQWKVIRSETLRLLEAGRVDEAAARLSLHGISGAKVAEIQSNLWYQRLCRGAG